MNQTQLTIISSNKQKNLNRIQSTNSIQAQFCTFMHYKISSNTDNLLSELFYTH